MNRKGRKGKSVPIKKQINEQRFEVLIAVEEFLVFVLPLRPLRPSRP
jgi:hypothetical protein